MKHRLPLYGTFLIWLVANILLVAGAAFFFFPERFGLGWNMLLTTLARERLQRAGRRRLRATWGPSFVRDLKVDLQRYDEDNKLRFGLYGGEGRRARRLLRHDLPRPVLDEVARTDVLMLAAIPGPLRNNLGVLTHDGLSPARACRRGRRSTFSELQRHQFVL